MSLVSKYMKIFISGSRLNGYFSDDAYNEMDSLYSKMSSKEEEYTHDLIQITAKANYIICA